MIYQRRAKASSAGRLFESPTPLPAPALHHVYINNTETNMKNGDVICEEHGHRLGDPDLIEAICDSNGLRREEWDALPEKVQHEMQLGWVSPMPDFASAEVLIGYIWLGEGHPCAN